MSGWATPYLRAKLVDHEHGVATFSPPATLNLALTTTILAKTDVTIPAGYEVVGNGYARQVVTMSGSTWTTAVIAADGTVSATNKTPIAYPAATADWTVAAVGHALVDDAGNVWRAGDLDPPLLPIAGQVPTLPAGTITRISKAPAT